MKSASKELLEANSDIINLLKIVNEIGWDSIRHHSIQRIIYLSKVLYSFVYNSNDNPFRNYHFTASITGPYSDLISKSIIFLLSNEYLVENNGEINIQDKKIAKEIISDTRKEWLDTIIYILGLYGENKIFGFTINDPLYKDAIIRNESKELLTSPDNLTIKKLNEFKEAFEMTLKDVSKIEKKEYIELYFEYVFSKIIKKDD